MQGFGAIIFQGRFFSRGEARKFHEKEPPGREPSPLVYDFCSRNGLAGGLRGLAEGRKMLTSPAPLHA